VEKLSLILWRQRELLDLLAFKLELEQLMLTAGRTRWLARCTNEVEAVLTQLRETEVLRAVAADEAAHALGLEPNPALSALAEASKEPWSTIFADHRQAFVTLVGEIKVMSEVNHGLLSVGYRSARETLAALGGTAEDSSIDGYSVDGSARFDVNRRPLVDRAL